MTDPPRVLGVWEDVRRRDVVGWLMVEDVGWRGSKGKFRRDAWVREDGGGGISCVMADGDVRSFPTPSLTAPPHTAPPHTRAPHTHTHTTLVKPHRLS